MTELIQELITPVIVGILLALFQHENKKRYDAQDQRAELHKKEALVNGEMIEATMELAYASAMALKRGKTNGEVEKGIKAYKKAKEAKEKFLKEISAEYMCKKD